MSEMGEPLPERWEIRTECQPRNMRRFRWRAEAFIDGAATGITWSASSEHGAMTHVRRTVLAKLSARPGRYDLAGRRLDDEGEVP